MERNGERCIHLHDNASYIESQTIYVSRDLYMTAPQVEECVVSRGTALPATAEGDTATMALTADTGATARERRAVATEAMTKVLEGCRGSLARGYDYNKVELAFRLMLGQTPTALPLRLQPLCTDLWEDFLLRRVRCTTEEEGGYIRATFLNIVGYWKSRGMFGRMTNEAVAMLFYPQKDSSNTKQVERGITNNERLAHFKPLLDFALERMAD